jgi:hypothetical protein
MSRFKQVRAELAVAAAAATILSSLSTAGCAGGPKPTAELAGAHTLVAQAEQSGAQQFDSVDLEAARSEMQQADQDAREQPKVAIRLAQQSSVDAQLALARTRALKAEEALRQINADTATLQSESEREHPAPTLPLPNAGGASTQYQ